LIIVHLSISYGPLPFSSQRRRQQPGVQPVAGTPNGYFLRITARRKLDQGEVADSPKGSG
jgi:hypothetical protein